MNKSDAKLLQNWKRKQNIVVVDIKKIKVKNNSSEASMSKSAIGESVFDNPVILRVKDNHYELVYGVRQLKECKAKGLRTVQAILMHESMEELLYRLKRGYREHWKITDIKIGEEFRNSSPPLIDFFHKIRLMLSGIVNPIIVDYHSKYLIDNYTTYLLLKVRGVKRVLVELDWRSS